MESGEGNPEAPATLGRQISEPLGLARPSPLGTGSWARWTDRWCHRSVYSWQMRTAMQMALEDRKTAITLLPYGCSGAEITEGLLYTYNGVEHVGPTPIGHTAQFGIAFQELCEIYDPPKKFPKLPAGELDTNLPARTGDPDQVRQDALAHVARCRVDETGRFKRDIDLLLFAIGINDVGFSKWVAGAITAQGSTARTLAGGFIPNSGSDAGCDRSCRLTKARETRLEKRYSVLLDIMNQRLLPAANLKPDHVVLAIYPNAVQNEDGETCSKGNRGMTSATFPGFDENIHACIGDIAFGSPWGASGAVFAVRNPAHLETIDRFRNKVLNRLAADFANKGGFTIIDSFANRFEKRGFCATKDPASKHKRGAPDCLAFPDFAKIPSVGCGDDDACIAAQAESLHIPRLYSGGDGASAGLWRPFQAPDFFSYRPRTRLFRSPNDVFMAINKRSPSVLDSNPIGALDLADRFTSGAMHPSAEGHSVIATSASDVARMKLKEVP
jgi:hypothetical protein